MANNLRVFNTLIEFEAATLVKPSVSYVVENDKVYYDDTPIPPTPTAFKWIATYSTGIVSSAECGVSSAITQNEISSSNCTDVQIGNCVTSIGNYAFNNSDFKTSLSSVTIGENVTSIGLRSFRNCKSIKTIDIPDSVTSIGADAFEYCSGLTTITIGSGVTSIGDWAFQTHNTPTYIMVKAVTPPTLGTAPFLNTGNCVIYVPSGSVNAYKTASGWSSLASRIQAIPTE